MFDRARLQHLVAGLSDGGFDLDARETQIHFDEEMIYITAVAVGRVLRQATSEYGLPDIDFGELSPTLPLKRSAIQISPLSVGLSRASEAESRGAITFRGHLFIKKGGTLPHPYWRFLVTQALPSGLKLNGELRPDRCGCFVSRDREKFLASSPVRQVMRRASQELLAIISKDPDQLLEVEHRDLERITALAAEDLGFDVELTRGSKDGGRDLVLRCHDSSGAPRCIVAEVKHWASGKRVGPHELRDLLTVVARDGADGGILISTSGFTATAQQLASTCEVIELIRLIDLDEMVTYIRESRTPSKNSLPPAGMLSDLVRKPIIDGGITLHSLH